MTNRPAATVAPLHPIQVVTRRTGLSADVIRAWEKRYEVVTPGRSPTGRRLYSDADIDRLRLLAHATLTGRTIGQIAALPTVALAALVQTEAAAAEHGSASSAGQAVPRRGVTRSRRSSSPAPVGTSPALDHLGACLGAVERHDGPALDAALRRAVIALSAESFLDTIVVPLWARVVAGESDGAFRPVHRHLTFAVLRRALDRVVEAATGPFAGPDLVTTTLPGLSAASHASQELGALLTAATAAADGWRVTSVGPGLSADDVAELVDALGAGAVALSLGSAPSDRAVPRELRRLRTLLPGEVAILLEGDAASAHQTLAREIDAFVLHDLPELRARLRAL